MISNIFFVGDIHGYYESLQRCNNYIEPQDIIIQVGDFGVGKNTAKEWENIYPAVKCPVYFIDGNHENFDIIDTWSKTEVTEVANGLFYVPRGMVLNLLGHRIGFLGGAESVDKAHRNVKEGPWKSWWKQERVEQEDVDRLVANVGSEALDILVTHCPPPITVLENFPMIDTQSWGLPSNWVDISSQRIADAIALTMPKKVFCGHMHKRVVHNKVRILDINEVVALDMPNDLESLQKVPWPNV